MIRKIVKIDEEKCTGCGLCASACHENAIVMENGKAHLLRDDFCDGFGDCLPACPAGAISIDERECAEYDPQAVEKRKQNLMQQHSESSIPHNHSGGCPGSAMHTFNRAQTSCDSENEPSEKTAVKSELMQWPVQIKLLPVQAPFYENANLLIAADCTAYAYAAFHSLPDGIVQLVLVSVDILCPIFTVFSTKDPTLIILCFYNKDSSIIDL